MNYFELRLLIWSVANIKYNGAVREKIYDAGHILHNNTAIPECERRSSYLSEPAISYLLKVV